MGPDTTQELWRNEFDKQYTKDNLRDVVKAANALIKRYERFTPRRSTDTGDDRLNTAVMKLLEGTRKWDPSRVDLGGFLLGVVASDLTSEMRRSKLAPHFSLDDRRRQHEDDYTGERSDDSNAVSSASIENGWPTPLAPESVDAAWSLAMTDLRARAGADAGVLALLAVYDEGVLQKRDVIALLKWSPRKYRDTYQRLVALADAADESVREAIAHAFTN